MEMLQRKHATYDNGFPANINFSCPVVVQVCAEPMQSVVLYTAKGSGLPMRCYFPYSFGEEFYSGIYTI